MHHGFALGADGEWDYEPRPSGRTDEWIDTHRFAEAEAIRLAHEAAPLVSVNGRTAGDLAGIRAEHAAVGAPDA